MSWLELSVRVLRQNVPLVEGLLQNQPVLALTLKDDADNPVLEPGVGETPLWPSVCVTALFDGDTNVDSLTRLLNLVPGVDRPQHVGFRTVEDQPWERVWLDRFKPMRFGSGLWIVPGNQDAPDDAIDVLRLDPGLAFGTGTHPTTRLCLQWMDGYDFRGQTVIDYGCGSGVLGIVAAIKGATDVICVDNDSQALIATRDNAGRNDVTNHINPLTPEQFEPVLADVLLANILVGPLMKLAPLLMASLRPGGTLVLSGILEEQTSDIVQAYQSYLDKVVVSSDAGWIRMIGQKTQTK